MASLFLFCGRTQFAPTHATLPPLCKGRCQSKIDGGVVPYPIRRRHRNYSLFTIHFSLFTIHLYKRYVINAVPYK